MDEIYQQFGDDSIDLIKERAEIMNMTTPSNINELMRLSTIEQLDEVPDTIASKEIVIADLRKMEWLLKSICPNYAEDLVTQNMLTDLNGAIGKFRWKLESTVF